MAELLPTDLTHIREVIVVDTHVPVAVGMATEALAALATGVATLPAMFVVDVAEQRLAETEDLSTCGAQVLLQLQTCPLVESQVFLRREMVAAFVTNLAALSHMHILLVTFH